MSAEPVLSTNATGVPESLQRRLLGEQIKDHVIEAIMAGEYEPGDRVVAKALAEQLGVSQAPVREAIRDLVLLGFLDNVPFKGTSVRCFSNKELYDVYEVRVALESLGARQAAERLTEQDAQGLRDILDRMIEAARAQDKDQMVRLDNEFHEEIVRISDNSMLYQVMQTIELGYWTSFTTRLSNYNLEDLARRHEALLEALESGDPGQAATSMQRHIEELARPHKSYDPKGRGE